LQRLRDSGSRYDRHRVSEQILDQATRERIERYLDGSSAAPAIVLEVGWVNGLGAIQTLARAGVRVLALDHRPHAIGLRSRYALPLLCPDPYAAEQRFAAFLSELVELLPAPTPIFATHDDGLASVARALPGLGGKLLCPSPVAEQLDLLQQKSWQLARAAEANVAVPQTLYPGSASEARQAASELGFPLFVKPSEPIAFRKVYPRRRVFRCDSIAELDDAYAKAEAYAPMLQEVVPGGDKELYTVGIYLDAAGRALGVFCGRKLRQTPRSRKLVPRGVGSCRYGESLWLPELVEDSLRLLRACDFTGIAQVEFKRDPRDGRFKLMEINPRLWMWHSLAAACGVNLAHIAYLDLTGRPPQPRTSEGRSKRWAITLMRGERPVVARPPSVEPLLSLRDPKPALVYLYRYAKHLGRL
jgi:predicted ATP-grasp superfamily ATP-dependent carboligase